MMLNGFVQSADRFADRLLTDLLTDLMIYIVCSAFHVFLLQCGRLLRFFCFREGYPSGDLLCHTLSILDRMRVRWRGAPPPTTPFPILHRMRAIGRSLLPHPFDLGSHARPLAWRPSPHDTPPILHRMRAIGRCAHPSRYTLSILDRMRVIWRTAHASHDTPPILDRMRVLGRSARPSHNTIPILHRVCVITFGCRLARVPF